MTDLCIAPGLPWSPLILLTAGVMVLVDRYARVATAWLGLWMLLLTLVVYVPLLFTAKDGMQLIEAVNYIFDTLLFCGTILLLASALPKKQPAPVAVMQTAV